MTLLTSLVGVKVTFKDDHDASGGLLPATFEEGNLFRVSVAGTLNSKDYGAGDFFLMQGGVAKFICGEDSTDLIKQAVADIITANTNISNNAAAISSNTANIGTNTTDIATNTTNIGTNVSGISTNANSIITNATNITTVTDDLALHEALVNAHIDWELASQGNIDITNLPESVQNGMTYQGEWDASTNIPVLTDATGTQGHYYRVSVGGTQDLGSGSQTFVMGDRVSHDGTIWSRWASSDSVSSVFGRAGDIIALSNDYNSSLITHTADSLVEYGGLTTEGTLNKLAKKDYVSYTAAFTAKSGGKYNCDTTTVAFAVTLPVGASGEDIIFKDSRQNWDINSVTINASASQVIESGSIGDPLILNIPKAQVQFIWVGGTIGWAVNVLN